MAALKRTHDSGCFWTSLVVIGIAVYLFMRVVFWFYDKLEIDTYKRAAQPSPATSPSPTPPPRRPAR